MRAARVRTVVAAGALTVAACLAGAGSASAATDWGPVVTLADQSFQSLSTVTTDNGMVVAVWSGRSSHNLYVAVRPSHGAWSAPTKIATTAAGVTLTKDGTGAWVLWQGFDDVSALQIGADGSIGTAAVIGSSSDPFQSDAMIATGAKGAVAAAWHTTPGSAAQIAYRAPGGDWTAATAVPQMGDIVGLVVGGHGTAQLLLAKNNPDFRHQEISYLRRSPSGHWSTPQVVAATAYLTSVEGNRNGDLVVGWETVNADGTNSLKARYKAADSPFGDTHELGLDVLENTHIALGIACKRLAECSAYRTQTTGSQQIQLTPADSTGFWLTPQDLSLTGSTYAVATNAAGDSVVTSLDGTGVQLVQCPAGGTCSSAESNPATGFRFPATTIGPQGSMTLVWGRGCKTEECLPSRLVTQRGTPAG